MLGRVGAVNAIAVKLARRNVVEIAVPDVLAALRQFDAFELAATLAVEQAQLHLFGVGRKQRKAGAPAIPACAKACRASRRQSHTSAFRCEKYRGKRRTGQSERGHVPRQAM